MTTLRLIAATLALGLLAACGADGAPERPDPRPAAGVTVSGSVSVGVAGTL
ncbi:argininosuccinate lyase [Rhodobacterales bacterium HKCCSP123]|nr:argininosuccinate lyase [Rhodobacterales bacterium HKCCSP123]